ncbi:MAG: hypothetical protein KGZ39_00190 [Simkania sp.]|nr:hypothetical protein [Simkania sp.]
MLINPFDFKKLISPITQEEFFEQYWEKKPLLLTDRHVDGYEGLLSLKDVDSLLSTLHAFDSSWIRFLNNKKEQNIGGYLMQNKMKTYLDARKVMAGFRAGNTIVLNSLHRRSEPLKKLCEKLEDVFGHSVHVNMYLTPADAQGFQAHYDAHDVLILQIEGEKIWKIYDQHVQFPIVYEDTPFFDTLNAPMYEVHLKPGDLLYLPRGYVHEALTAKEYSLHLTVGIHVVTWMDFLMELAKEENILRKALPRQVLCTNGYNQIQEEVRQALESLCKDQDRVEKAHTKLRKKILETKKSVVHEGFTAMYNAENITATTMLGKREDVEFSISMEDEYTLIQFGEEKFSAPVHAKPFLDHIFRISQFSVRSLPKDLDALSESNKLALIRPFVRAGVLKILTS